MTRGHFSHISQWLPALADLTFKTKFLEFTHDQGRALQKLTEYSRAVAQHARLDGEGAEAPDPWSLLTEAQQASIEQLRSRLDETLASLASDAFVRLDTRSPKDAVLLLPSCYEILQRLLESRHFDDPYSAECETFDSACAHRAIVTAQRVRDATGALDLLRHSQRVEADLVLGQVSNSGDAASRLVLRQWSEDIDPLLELRAFVCRGHVTGISQYYKTCYVPELLEQQDTIKRLVCEAVEAIHKRFQHLLGAEDLYTLDFALMRDAEGRFCQAFLVEVNPPPPVAGTILFDWEDPKDRALLKPSAKSEEDEADPICALRLVARPVPWSSIPFHPPLKAFADRIRGRSRGAWLVHLAHQHQGWLSAALVLLIAAAWRLRIST